MLDNNVESEALFTAAVEAARGVPAPLEVAVPETAPPLPAGEVPPVPPAAEPPVVAEQAPVPPEVEKPADPAVVSTEVPTDNRFAPRLLKLMEREGALVEREKQFKAAEAELAGVKEQISSLQAAQNKFSTDPVAFIRSMAPNVSLKDIAKALWYEELGDAAPPEAKADRAVRVAKTEVEQLRAELTGNQQRWIEDQQRQQADAAYHQYVGAIGEFSKAVPDEYPLVKAFATEDSARVQRGLFKIAQNHAAATGGQVLTPAECAAKLQSELSSLQKVLAPQPTQLPPTPVKNDPPVTSTLRNKHTSVQPNRSIPPEDDPEYLFQRAMDAAKAVGEQKK